jgi:hypothetical protein
MKKFIVSAADVTAYSDTGDIMFIGKTLLDSSIETSLSNTDVRAGRGNPLIYVAYHSPEMNIQVSDAQWNLDLLSKNVGSEVLTGNNVFTEELVTLAAAGAGTVVGTPLTNAAFGSSVFGWVTLKDGETVEKVTFAVKNFSCSGAEGDVVSVKYYALNAASRSLTIRSDMVPSIAYLVMEAQLCSSDVATNVIGKVQIVVPKASMTGAFSIAMTPDSVASTPLSVRAFRSDMLINGVMTPVMATITEIIANAVWSDNLRALAIENGDFALSAGTPTKQLTVWAIPVSGAAFRVPVMSDLTYTSSTPAAATVSAGGLVTRVAAGSSTIKVAVTAKPAVNVEVIATVS